MTQLPALSESHLPQPIDPSLEAALSAVSGAIDWGTGLLPVDRSLSPILRERLASRADDVFRWLAPCGPDRLGEPSPARIMAAALLAVLPVQGGKGSVEDAEKVQGLYVRALADLPRFALRAACATALTRGLGGNRKFAPSPAELRAEAEREAHPLRDEAARLRRVLTARIEPPRPSDEVRRASAAAARKAFGIPESSLKPGARPHDAIDGFGTLGASARDLFLRSSLDAWRRRQAEASGAICPDDRFPSQDAAE